MSTPTHPAYGRLREVTPAASVLLENNPNMMTLDGTNSWVLRAPGDPYCVVVDPGEDDAEHRALLAACAPVALVLLTHHHPDHASGAARFAEVVDAPVRAFDPELCSRGADALVEGEVVQPAGLSLRVLHTPGHTDDSVCLLGDGIALTGDTVLGRGTTVLHHLGDYLGSLRGLAELPPDTVGLPGHGPELADLPATAREYLDHRQRRLDQVSAALEELGPDAAVRQIVEHVYADVDPALWAPAEHSVRAQLDYLRG
ncbi:MAG: MBL fold metallo-hydrolase [Nocardioidaceae bacterium]